MEKGRRSPLAGAAEVVAFAVGVDVGTGVAPGEGVGSGAGEDEEAAFPGAAAAAEVDASASLVVGADASLCALGFLFLVRFLPVDELVVAGADIVYVFWGFSRALGGRANGGGYL